MTMFERVKDFMSAGLISKMPELSKMLDKLYNVHEVYELARNKSPNAREELASCMMDVMQFRSVGDVEREIVTDILLQILLEAEKALRTSLAIRLSTDPNVPLRLILNLCNDDIEVAAPVLRNSPILSDLDLIYMIKSQGPSYWQAIASRHQMGPSVIDLLAETGDEETSYILADNKSVTLTDRALELLSEMATGSEHMALCLVERPEMRADLALKLFDAIGPILKDHIETRWPESVSQAAAKELNQIRSEIESAKAGQFMPHTDLIEKAAMLGLNHQINLRMILDTLRRGEYAFFIALFAQYGGIAPKIVHDLICNPDGKGVAVLCRALDLYKGDCLSIYLMSRVMRDDTNDLNQKQINALGKSFERSSPEACRRYLKSLQKAILN